MLIKHTHKHLVFTHTHTHTHTHTPLYLLYHIFSLVLLALQHNTESLPGLMGTILVNQVMHINEQHAEVLDLGVAFRGCRIENQYVQQLQKTYQYGSVQLLQFGLPVCG